MTGRDQPAPPRRTPSRRSSASSSPTPSVASAACSRPPCPTIAFTVIFLTQHDLRLAIFVSLALRRRPARGPAGAALVACSSCSTRCVGIGIGALFAWRAARGGGDEGDQALAYFLPGLLYNLGYAARDGVHHRDPLAVGRLHRGQRGRRPDRLARRPQRRPPVQPADLAARPAVHRCASSVQGPIYLAGRNGWWSTDSAVAALGVAKLAMGWPLQVAALAGDGVAADAATRPRCKPGEPEPHLHA